MPTETAKGRIYDGEGDRLMSELNPADKLMLVPDAPPSKTPDVTPRLRIMWGQHLLEDLLAGRYRSVVCAVNAQDNKRGIITQLAKLLPTSQWNEQTITNYAKHFSQAGQPVKVIKFDMDMVEVLAVLHPPDREHLTLADLKMAFKIVGEMVRAKSERQPSASVSFLGARANKLLENGGREPAFEVVLRTMHEAGFSGDVYPAPWMWSTGDTGLFARYPFPASLESMRQGGF